MDKVKVRDKEFSLFLTAEEIDKAVEQVAEMINADMQGKDPLFLCVLNGAFIFASDLLKKVEVDCEISFVKLSSYVGTQTTNTVRELIGLDQVLTDRTVVVVEDIIDTGITMSYTLEKLRKLGASDVRIATLLFKPEAFKKDYPIDYVGIVIPNEFIVGYGLDYDGHGRNFPDIYKIIED
ncbi:MAG: hypoxanthine phosphoribosyltransferase [Bacteroidales bacterium]|jgi:hypoxanthine phosphoribosyltransferase|nr:hypoxanthine phosphoribosyltransferase [Bacteroidales bacterium]